ncbi:penicillin-binding protein 2 [Glacieibacterium frigidum]|uniref:Penicillin-binding protein 2 n=1 Tax=Glacieibacterium frigidum TaxID=2593303 RepID=A0A552UH49_9SPHN|nr:penicillin-binding protein 2 [Glacieibacterium frigidum]TRW17548.1 penicillin-binding protein 2 [Glacieibacterium frigidum]
MNFRTEAEREQVFARRAVLLGGGMALVGATLGARMAYLSLFEGEKYRLASEDNRVSLRLIPPRRGWIVDRAGLPLAANAPDYGLELIPEQVRDLEATLRAIMGVLPLTLEDLTRIRADVARLPGAMPVAVASGLAWPQFAALNVRLPDLPGVVPVQSFGRVYAGGPAFAHLLGYVGAPTPEQYQRERDPLLVFPGFKLGKDGIERTQDAVLRGKPGARRVEVNARGKIVRELDTKADEPGANVRLTIDRGLQSYAARRLGDESASVIVMDCQTGDVLCMLSSPAYDPNVFSTRVPTKLWKSLQSSDAHPLINKSAQGLYPPGSTFKMVTALAALKAGISPEDAVVCRGVYRYGRGLWHCHSRRGHGHVDLHSAIPQSCDVYFYTYGRAAGNQAIADMARVFGLGQKFDLPLPGQAKGIVPDAAWKEKRYGKDWTIGETLNASIGQGYLIANPLQLAVMAARLATGRAVEPRLLADGPRAAAPSLGIPEEHLAIVRQGMVDVVNGRGGTATRSRVMVDGIVMAGKTGTAQVKRITMAERRRGVTRQEQMPWKYRDHALFVAYAPVINPRYAVSVIVEHGMHGGTAAAPVARDVLTYLFEPERANATLRIIEADAARRKAANEAAAKAAADAAAAAAPAPAPPPVVT